MNAIETKGLTKSYGKARGIVGLDLDVEEGEFFGFIGPNGASEKAQPQKHSKSPEVSSLRAFPFLLLNLHRPSQDRHLQMQQVQIQQVKAFIMPHDFPVV